MTRPIQRRVFLMTLAASSAVIGTIARPSRGMSGCSSKPTPERKTHVTCGRETHIAVVVRPQSGLCASGPPTM